MLSIEDIKNAGEEYTKLPNLYNTARGLLDQYDKDEIVLQSHLIAQLAVYLIGVLPEKLVYGFMSDFFNGILPKRSPNMRNIGVRLANVYATLTEQDSQWYIVSIRLAQFFGNVFPEKNLVSELYLDYRLYTNLLADILINVQRMYPEKALKYWEENVYTFNSIVPEMVDQVFTWFVEDDDAEVLVQALYNKNISIQGNERFDRLYEKVKSM